MTIDETHPILKARKGTIEFTNGQKEALLKVAKFLETKGEHFFLLAGYSGCGKTTIAENIVTFAKAHVLAPTNTAVDRLKSKFSADSFSTIHRCLFSPLDDNGKFMAEKSFERNKTYVIDECSMIDTYVLEVIINDAVERGCKIIFLGK
jgi:energy-coupling factor transporter ATP-binding protein EcfA2